MSMPLPCWVTLSLAEWGLLCLHRGGGCACLAAQCAGSKILSQLSTLPMELSQAFSAAAAEEEEAEEAAAEAPPMFDDNLKCAMCMELCVRPITVSSLCMLMQYLEQRRLHFLP